MRLSKNGFTLMELMIVIIILGILVTIASPMYYKSIEKAKMAEAVNNLGAIRSSEYRYYAYRGGTVTITVNELDVGDPSLQVAEGQIVRFGNYNISGNTIGSLTYSCIRNTTDFFGVGIPSRYTVSMNASGSVTTSPAF